MMSLRRYVVSLWSYEGRASGESPLYLRKEIISSSEDGALHGVMQLVGLSFAHYAKVVDVRTNACHVFNNPRVKVSSPL